MCGGPGVLVLREVHAAAEAISKVQQTNDFGATGNGRRDGTQERTEGQLGGPTKVGSL